MYDQRSAAYDGSTGGDPQLAQQLQGLRVQAPTSSATTASGYGFSDPKAEMQYYMRLSLDGVFTDFPLTGVEAVPGAALAVDAGAVPGRHAPAGPASRPASWEGPAIYTARFVLSDPRGPAMPIYAYNCGSCGHAKDVLQKISDAPLTRLPGLRRGDASSSRSPPPASSSRARAGT